MQLTRPTGDETSKTMSIFYCSFNCNSHAPQGTKHFVLVMFNILQQLQLTRPTGDETHQNFFVNYTIILQLTRPTGDETNISIIGVAIAFAIATHTPHRGRNYRCVISVSRQSFYCNSHAPQGTKQNRLTPPYHRKTDCNSHAPQGTKRLRPQGHPVYF